MKNRLYILLLLLMSLNTKVWCQALPDLPQSELEYSVYLIGDAGDAVNKSQPILNSLQAKLMKSDADKTTVAFLGDNLYPEGLHKKNSSFRAEDEARLKVQLDAVKGFDGRILFIPGNHDWDKGRKSGIKHLKRQEKFVQEYLNKGNVFRPSHGCPGPEVIKVSEDLTFIILDTQWWLHQHDKPKGEKDRCEVSNTDELLAAFKEALKKNRSKNIVVLAHHPLLSNGSHGGFFTAKDHIFPLTKLNKKLYVPLPIIGSVYPFYRKYMGNIQDLAHPYYKDMATKIKKAINEYDNVIYVAGHEHNLQYVRDDRYHHIVSGSGSKVTYVKKNNRITYGAKKTGYARLMHYKNGEMWLEFITVNQKDAVESIDYRKKLFQSKPHKDDEVEMVYEKKDYSGMYAKVVPDSTFYKGKVHRLLMGEMHRDLWAKPLQVPYLNIHFEKGGLTPMKKGGGMQSISLRMKGEDGKQYVIRGIKKNANFLIERNLRGTLAQDAIYDGISGSHPYASVVIGQLSDAAGIYHTNPKLVYVPDDPVLGDYQKEFGGMFCLFEERPDGNMSDEKSFGNSKDVLGYDEVYDKVHNNFHHQIDYKSVLKARLFDMLIGDWDRHDDQWRWAGFKKKGVHTYRPIPRDRDQAFFRFDGILPSIVNRKWLVPKFQPFKDNIRDIRGLGFNARYFDRSNLTALNKEQWLKIAKKLQRNMTDEVIEKAIRSFPKEAYDFSGEYITKTLKHRRDNIVNIANEYYHVLAKEVDILGTFQNDFFEVTRKENGNVELNIYPRKKGKRQKGKRFFHRVFKPQETKEIRLYGLDGEDEFKVTGSSKKSIVVRIISGEGKTKVDDDSHVAGLRKKTQVYTFKKKDNINSKGEVRTRFLKTETDHYEYNRKEFVYDKLMPSLSVGFNPNDGFYFGPAVTYTKQGFKKKPFKYQHKFSGARTFGAKGWNAKYNYRHTELVGPLDFNLLARASAPLVYQYYGKGNETKKTDNFKDFNVRMNDYEVNPSLNYSNLNNTQNIQLSLDLRHISFDQKPIVPYQDWEVEDQTFYGLSLGYDYKNMNKDANASRGVHFMSKGSWNKGASNSQINFFRLQSSLALYIPLNITKKQTVLALRSGGAKNFGDYAFFQANFLDGFKNFRGVRRNRYAGDAIQYNNIDLRQSLIKFQTYAAPLDVGLLGHYDIGKSWTNGISSSKWHSSYGGGVFLNILDYFSIQGTYSISQDDKVISIGAFLF